MRHELLPVGQFTLMLPNLDHKAGKKAMGTAVEMKVIQHATPRTPAFSTEAHW